MLFISDRTLYTKSVKCIANCCVSKIMSESGNLSHAQIICLHFYMIHNRIHVCWTLRNTLQRFSPTSYDTNAQVQTRHPTDCYLNIYIHFKNVFNRNYQTAQELVYIGSSSIAHLLKSNLENRLFIIKTKKYFSMKNN